MNGSVLSFEEKTTTQQWIIYLQFFKTNPLNIIFDDFII